MILENITNDNLVYDNSLKKVISKIKYNKKKIIVKIDKIEIIKKENNTLFIKNSDRIKKIFNVLNNTIQEKFNIDNFIFLNDFENNDILEFHCFIKNDNFEKKKENKINILLSHLESISNKIYCQCYVINIL